MGDLLTELAGHFRHNTRLPDADLLQLVSAARTAGYRWSTLAAAREPGAETEEPAGILGTGAAGRLFRDVYDASERTRNRPPSWPCPECGQQVTDVAALGRPVHTDLGHTAAYPRLALDQAADDQQRRQRIPALITSSEYARGPLQRHRLAEVPRLVDSCPRCGWRGFYGTHSATLNGDWTRLLCDDCYADLSPDIAVSVTYFACQYPGRDPFGVIRQRARSDETYPDLGQIITWDLRWGWTSIMVEEARDGADCEVTRISQDAAEVIIESLARRYWPAEALRLPWVEAPYPN